MSETRQRREKTREDKTRQETALPVLGCDKVKEKHWNALPSNKETPTFPANLSSGIPEIQTPGPSVLALSLADPHTPAPHSTTRPVRRRLRLSPDPTPLSSFFGHRFVASSQQRIGRFHAHAHGASLTSYSCLSACRACTVV